MDQKDMLLSYSQLLTQVADDYMAVEEEESDQERAALFRQRENHISRVVFGRFMLSTARQIEQLSFYPETENEREKKYRVKLEKMLRSAGMVVHHFYRRKNRNGYTEIGMTVSSVGNHYFETAEVAELLSRIYRKNMLSVTENTQYIHQKPVRLCFQEEVRYGMLAGVAKAVKDGETISGDSYLMREFGDGTYIAAIADGMGSGEEACRMSEKVLSLLERFIESGMSIPDFRDTCNSFLYMRRDLEQSVTVDIMECNQYTGEVTFYKNGGGTSYLMQGSEIQKIPASQHAFGIKMNAEKEKTKAYVEAGDCMIMMSDGAMEFYAERGELLYQMFLKNKYGPNELAAEILRQAVIASGGKMTDDMTVLAICVCDV